MKPKKKRNPRKPPQKDVWIQIMHLLAAMPKPERDRCIAATVAFFRDRTY